MEVDSILRSLKPSKELHIPKLDPVEKKRKLEVAFGLITRCLKGIGNQKPDKKITFLLAEVLWKYASSHHEDNYFATKQMLLVSLNMHLYAIGLLNECIDIKDYRSLDDLKEQGADKPQLFAFMDHIIMTTSPEVCIAAAKKNTFLQAYPERRLISLAQTLRWLGDCYQQLDMYKGPSQENDLRFKNLFHTSEALLLLAGNDESQHELAELYCDAWPFMHKRAHPEDYAGIIALYDKALAYNPSREMQARVANKRFLTLFHAGKEDEAITTIRKAKAMAETLKDTEANRFLLANIYYNYTCALLNPAHFDLEQAEIHLTRALRYAAQTREKGRDRMCFASYDMLMAQFRLATGKFNKAKAAAERALQTVRKYPHSQQPHVFKAEALVSFVDKMISAKAHHLLSGSKHFQ